MSHFWNEKMKYWASRNAVASIVQGTILSAFVIYSIERKNPLYVAPFIITNVASAFYETYFGRKN